MAKTTNNDNGKYYTHPAFTTKDKELSGIWVSKYDASPLKVNFKMSTDKTAVCVPKLDGFDETKTYYVTYENNTETVGSLISEPAPDNWYDYTNKQWANIKIVNTVDGIEVDVPYSLCEQIPLWPCNFAYSISEETDFPIYPSIFTTYIPSLKSIFR